MLRFCGKGFVQPSGVEVVLIEDCVCFNKNIWQDNRKHFRSTFSDDVTVVRMLPLVDDDGEIICYGWQDDEANRELRMLRELEQSKTALQFRDIFPTVEEVIVRGCNELAYYFVKYLKTQQIKVSVTGRYWRLLGYQCITDEETCNKNRMVICAEEAFQDADLYHKIVRSASSEFECIDKIYEANVLAGKIKDAGGDFEWLVEQLRNRNIVILGTNPKTQDTYDLLYEHGIDIAAFVDKGSDGKTLLGKQIVRAESAFAYMEDVIFICCTGKNSALGTELIEKYDYYGYKRNLQFFLIDDYVEVPYSNLIHVLKGKRVLLAGDTKLCRLLQEYLEQVEDNNINLRRIELNCDNVCNDDILCIVHPWCGVENVEYNLHLYRLREQLRQAGDISYTEYFMRSRAFVIIDEFLNRNTEKYTVCQLVPKGILLGAIPTVSGNYFVRGILDGHPDILMLPDSDWNTNLFLYCICLACEKAEDIPERFKDMVNVYKAAYIFYDWEKFEKSLRELLIMKEWFSSQEIFLIIHIAYAEMVSGRKITDISSKVIYWEPHNSNKMDFPFWAKWLESKDINGNTLVMRRNGITRCGSQYKIYMQNNIMYNILFFVAEMSIDYLMSTNISDKIGCNYWKEIKMRFEDLKLHPQEELLRICRAVGITWSDTFLHTTWQGNVWEYGEIKDFDLKPVFNRYEEYFSEFDRFRLSIICSAYQKKYGYVYENCMRFTRVELWSMFLKEFRFQMELQFTDERKKSGYYLSVYEILRWQLWNARKDMLLDNIVPEFEPVEISCGKG